MPVLDDIRSTLEVHLSNATGLPSIIGWENADTAKGAGDAFIRVQFIPTSRRPAVRGPNPQNRYQGLFRLTVCVPVDSGTGTAWGYVDTLLARFDGSDDIAGSSVTVSVDYAETGSPYEDEPFFCIPVEIAWYIYSQ